jgi:hypothetical protein
MEPVRHIFILSAMRSGSTLLQHIVGQHGHLLSAGETKIEYTHPDRLGELRDYLFEYQEIPADQRAADHWVFLEKCVHDRYLPATAPIEGPSVRFLFIVRQPHPALSSLMELKGWPYAESVEAAHWYYTHRFQSLVRLAAGMRNPELAYFLTYEDFVARTAYHLDGMTQFLGYAEPLLPAYPRQKWTARLSLGDVSDTIRSQQVVSRIQRPLVDLPPELAESLAANYLATVQQLATLCRGQAIID